MMGVRELVTCIEALPREYNAAVDLLGRNLIEGRSEKVAYIDSRGSWTYGALADRVDRVGGMLKTLGVQAEQRVLMCLLDTIDFPTVFLGAIKAGVVPVPVNTLFPAETYAYMLRDSRARVAFVSEALVDKFDQIAAQCPDLQTIVVTGEGADRTRLETLLAAAPPVAQAAPTHRDEAAFWLYTSGSTGEPKGVVHCHGSLRLTADLYAIPSVGYRESDVVHSVAKLFFAYGLGNGLTFPLAVGATTVLHDGRPTPDACTALMLKHDVTVLCGSPTFFAAWLDHPGCPTREQAKSLRAAVSAGEALPEALGRTFLDRFGVWILDGLGSTEMLHIFISQQPGALKLGASGKPVPGYEARLIDDAGEIAPDGVLGELQVRGPTAALCYWNNRPKSTHTFMGEWTRTGDKYIRDEEGFYCYSGRSDDMLKVSGIYVSPFDVEAALIRHPSVLEAAVVAWLDKDGLVKPKAFVVLSAANTDAPEALEAALRAHVKALVAAHAYPRWIEFVSDLPKTATGKIQRFKLRQLQDG
jgi:benzoate-CoA ligase